MYITDTGNQRIRKIAVSTNVISSIVGSGLTGFTGDNSAASSSQMSYPDGLAIDSSGNIYISDWGNNRVRKVTIATGIITTIAGSGATGNTSGSFSGDGGAATSATMSTPFGVALDSAGNVYVTDQGSNRIRKVTISTSLISTIAGSGSTVSFSGDNGQATAATINNPLGVGLDTSGSDYTATKRSLFLLCFILFVGNVYIADYVNHRIRKVTVSTGIITTVAGSGGTGAKTGGTFSGDGGAATSALLYGPTSIAIDASGSDSIK